MAWNNKGDLYVRMKQPERAMECFDISHISGTFVVASMVHFADGRPDKNNYRRFQIKSFIGNDDFRAMEEVVGRRYRRLAEENKPFPNLVVIDGGRGQIGAALKAFVALNLTPPALIGLACRRLGDSEGAAMELDTARWAFRQLGAEPVAFAQGGRELGDGGGHGGKIARPPCRCQQRRPSETPQPTFPSLSGV